MMVLLLLTVFFITGGFMDLDWQLVSYRFSDWHRSVDYWEYAPYLKINWHIGYLLNVGRLIFGCILLGWILRSGDVISG